MYCKNCGKQLEDGVKFCSDCGTPTGNPVMKATPAASPVQEPTAQPARREAPKKKKKSIFKRWWFWAIVIAVLFVSCVDSEPAGPEQPVMSESEYKATCEEIDFDTLARNPESYAGNLYTFTGEVLQVVEYSSYIEMRVDVTPVLLDGEVMYYEDTIYMIYHPAEGESKILEGDIITIYGQCAGEETYTSIFGETITLPRINIMYYELVSE